MSFENSKNITLHYTLYVDGEMVEKTSEERPLNFISGLNIMLPDFEANVSACTDSEEFDFVIPAKQAYGEIDPESVMDIPMSAFLDNNGKLNDEVKIGNSLQMISEDGRRFNAIVIEIGTETIKMDFNHPFAGKDLHFKGQVISNRQATTEEIQTLLNQMTGCGGGCSGGCGGGCNCSDGNCCGSCGE